MRKEIYFGDFDGPFWPLPAQLEPFFVDPAGESWPRDGGNDEWGLSVDGLYGTNDLADEQRRVRVDLYFTGYPKLGVTLQYSKWDGRVKQRSYFVSQGNARRMNEIVYSMQGTPMSAGLFVSFSDAYLAVKEFIETDGGLPTCIKWGPDANIPDEAFLGPRRSK